MTQQTANQSIDKACAPQLQSVSATQPAPSPSSAAATLARKLAALDTAVDQSHTVKAKVEEFAEDLGSDNKVAKTRIARGETTLPATQALQSGLDAESRVQGYADDLQQVTDNLADGVEEVKAVEQALDGSRAALAQAQADLAASRNAERAATQRAMHDQKTGLANAALFEDRLEHAIAGAKRHDWILAVMFLDLDGFKQVNDTHGHAAGDSVLKVVAHRLTHAVRAEDTVSRYGGDEFLYLLIAPTGRDNVARIAGLVREAIEAPISLGAAQVSITPSIGIALYPENGTDVATLIAHADAAMYRAKQTGSHFEFFDPSMAASASSQPQTE